jgi:hypothetical protein
MVGQLRDNGALVITGPGEPARLDPQEIVRQRDREYSISEVRKLLGDDRVGFIWLDHQATAADREIIKAFPDANVFEARDSDVFGAVHSPD